MKTKTTRPAKLTQIVRYCIAELIETGQNTQTVIKWMKKATQAGYTTDGFVRIFNKQPEVQK